MADEPKKSRGEAAREVIAGAELLPPDPVPADRTWPGKMLPKAAWDKRPPSEGRALHEAGVSPKQLRRRCLAMLHQELPEIVEKAVILAKGGLNPGEVDQRVQAVMINAIMDRVVGKAGELPNPESDPTGMSGLDMTKVMQHLSLEECDRLNDALRIVHDMKALAAERMASV